MVRHEMMYLEDESTRQLSYAKRRNGLIKKALEISVLCDVEVAYISFSPSGRLSHFSGDKRIEDVLARFVELPEQIRQFPIPDLEYLKAILNQIKRETEEQIQDQRVFALKAEISLLKEEIQKVQADIRKFEPDPDLIMSTKDIDVHEKFLEDTLRRVNERVIELNGESSNARAADVHQPPSNAVNHREVRRVGNGEEEETTGESSSSNSEDSIDCDAGHLNSTDGRVPPQSTEHGIQMLPRGTFQSSPAVSPVIGTGSTQFLAPRTGHSLSNSALPGTHQAPSTMESSQLQSGAFQEQDMNPININQTQTQTQTQHNISSFAPFEHDYMYQPSTLEMMHNSGAELAPRDFMSQLTGNYLFPTSTLPPEFRLGSSSPRRQAQSRGSERYSPYARPPWANRYPQSSPRTMFDSPSALGTQDYQFQGLLSSIAGTSSFNPIGGLSNEAPFSSMPMQKGTEQFSFQGFSNPEGYNMQGMHGNTMMNARQFEVGSSSRGKQPMVEGEDMPRTSNLFGSRFGSPRQIFNAPALNASTSNPSASYPPNSVYDPTYEAMGLPVDPHVRIFLSRKPKMGAEIGRTELSFVGRV